MSKDHLDEVNKALGLGEDFDLGNGSTIKVYPVAMADLQNAMALWDRYASVSRIQFLYLPGKEENLKAFEELLLMANGKRDVAEEDRADTVQTIIAQFPTMADQGKKVQEYIDRFLGFIPGDTGAAKED